MMNERMIAIDGTAARALVGAPSRAALVFVSGSTPGVTPWASGVHLWGPVLERFAAERPVVAIELPGTGASDVPAAGLALPTLAARVTALLAALGIERAHLVGHDLAGLVALGLAASDPQLVRSVTAVASLAAAPTGDSMENLTHAHPPAPRWSRDSQRWALERIVHSHHSIDDAFVDACVSAAAGAPHRAACEWMAANAADVFAPSLAGAKTRLFRAGREAGYPVPAQVIWGTQDPLGTFEQGLWSYRILAAKQKATQFHAINRAGNLPFREAPEVFHQVVAAFCDAVFPV